MARKPIGLLRDSICNRIYQMNDEQLLKLDAHLSIESTEKMFRDFVYLIWEDGRHAQKVGDATFDEYYKRREKTLKQLK